MSEASLVELSYDWEELDVEYYTTTSTAAASQREDTQVVVLDGAGERRTVKRDTCFGPPTGKRALLTCIPAPYHVDDELLLTGHVAADCTLSLLVLCHSLGDGLYLRGKKIKLSILIAQCHFL